MCLPLTAPLLLGTQDQRTTNTAGSQDSPTESLHQVPGCGPRLNFLQRSASKITIYKGYFQGNSKDRGPSYVLTKSYLWHPLKHTYLQAVRTPRTSASLPQEGRNSQVSLSPLAKTRLFSDIRPARWNHQT